MHVLISIPVNEVYNTIESSVVLYEYVMIKMKLTTLLTCLCSSAATSASSPNPNPNTNNDPPYRISPIDGSKIALPTTPQLSFQSQEIGVLIHFNIATYLSIDGCNNVPSLVPNTSLFTPSKLNTDQWLDAITSLGAKYATLVVKHNCGFALWPSNISFPVRSDGHGVGYEYSVENAPPPVQGEDIVRDFVDSAKKAGVGHGFYYSTVVNNYLNVQDAVVRPIGTWADGQVNITNSTYDGIVFDQLSELWEGYGDLTEVCIFPKIYQAILPSTNDV